MLYGYVEQNLACRVLQTSCPYDHNFSVMNLNCNFGCIVNPSWYGIFDLTDIGCQKPYLWQPWHIDFALHPHKLYMVIFSMTSAFDGCEAWASVTISLWVMNLNKNSRYRRFIVRTKAIWRFVQSVKLQITEIQAILSVFKISTSFKRDNKAIEMGFENSFT